MWKQSVKSMCAVSRLVKKESQDNGEKSDRLIVSDHIDIDDIDETYPYNEDVEEDCFADHSVFKPIYSIGYRNDPDDNDSPCASLAILSFTVIDMLSDFSITIVGDSYIEYKALWPEHITINTVLRRMWLEGKGRRSKLAEYHGMVKCFEKMMAPL